jgi:hypothetical protein
MDQSVKWLPTYKAAGYDLTKDSYIQTGSNFTSTGYCSRGEPVRIAYVINLLHKGNESI